MQKTYQSEPHAIAASQDGSRIDRPTHDDERDKGRSATIAEIPEELTFRGSAQHALNPQGERVAGHPAVEKPARIRDAGNEPVEASFGSYAAHVATDREAGRPKHEDRKVRVDDRQRSPLRALDSLVLGHPVQK